MEREDYLELRKKRLRTIAGLYNPDPELSIGDDGFCTELSFSDKLADLEDNGIIRIIELDDLMHDTDNVIGLNENGVYEINSSVYKNDDRSTDEELRRIIADAIGVDSTAEEQKTQIQLFSAIPTDNAGIAAKFSELLMGTGMPYAAILTYTEDGFKSVFEAGFSVGSHAIFSFSEGGDVCREILHPRRTVIINSGFCSLVEFSSKISKCDKEHISSCCFAPLGAGANDGYIFFAFDSALISPDNVNKIIKKINNIPNVA